MNADDTVDGKIALLIADDHPIFRAGLKQIVERLGWLRVVAEADAGESALAQIRYLQPDMAILDIAMPGMDGLEVLARLAEQPAMPAVIIVTSYDDRAYMEHALQLGARAFVLKDSAGEDMAYCLEAVRRGELFISPTVGAHTPKLPRVAPQESPALDSLTRMERDVLGKVAQFKTSKEIALELGISYRTVQNHRANICTKLGLRGTHQLMALAREYKHLLD